MVLQLLPGQRLREVEVPSVQRLERGSFQGAGAVSDHLLDVVDVLQIRLEG